MGRWLREPVPQEALLLALSLALLPALAPTPRICGPQFQLARAQVANSSSAQARGGLIAAGNPRLITSWAARAVASVEELLLGTMEQAVEQAEAAAQCPLLIGLARQQHRLPWAVGVRE